MEQGVEAVDDATVANGEAELDHLSRVEMGAQFIEEFVRDRCHARTGLGESHDGRLIGAEDTFGEWIVAQVGDLLVGEPYVSTETDVGGYSIVAVVGDRSGEVRKLSLVGTDVGDRRRLGAEVEERLEQIGMVGERAKHVEVTAGPLAQPKQQRPSFGVRAGVVGIDERNASHRSNLVISATHPP